MWLLDICSLSFLWRWSVLSLWKLTNFLCLDYCRFLLLCLEISMLYFFWPFISLFKIFKKNFIYLFLAVLDLCCCAGFSLWQSGATLAVVPDFSLKWLLLLWSQALEHRLNRYGTWALLLHGTWSSWIRDQSCVSCIGRWDSEPPGKPL